MFRCDLNIKAFWFAIAVVFLVGLTLRIIAMDLPSVRSQDHVTRWDSLAYSHYLEHDERIYIALTEQLEAGRGYTLQGNPILDEHWITREQYDRPLFYHPPGGIVLFWVTHQLAGTAGYALAQVLSFGIFFWSVLLLTSVVLLPFNRVAVLAAMVLASFTPILGHVAGRFWLEGPLLAFSTAAAAVFLLGIKRSSMPLVCLAGALLGYASLIKLTAFLIVPGSFALAWAITSSAQQRRVIVFSLMFVGVGVLIQLPWEIWQWLVLGTVSPNWAGKPIEEMVRANPYVYYVTVTRSPWVYLELLPQVIWTLIPSLILLAMQWRNRELRNRGLALLSWIVLVVGVHVTLGMMGYSKLLRYVILITPATVLLFALVMSGAFQGIREGKWLPGGKGLTVALLTLATVGLGLEITQGLKTSLIDNQTNDLIIPLMGLPK